MRLSMGDMIIADYGCYYIHFKISDEMRGRSVDNDLALIILFCFFTKLIIKFTVIQQLRTPPDILMRNC